jgi:hypothetical protein
LKNESRGGNKRVKEEEATASEERVQVISRLGLEREKRRISRSSLEHFGNRYLFGPMYATIPFPYM